MFYKFNGLSGRLETSTQMAAYHPQGLRTATESKGMIFGWPNAKTAKVAEPLLSGEKMQMSTTAAGSKAAKIAAIQKAYQADPHVLVHFKRGLPDKILFYTTGIIGAAGLVYAIGQLFSKRKS